jgi:hypothetical protein
MKSADRQRRYLRRQRDGLCVLPVVAVEDDVAAMLLDCGFISAAELRIECPKQRRQALADAASRWIFDLVTRHGQRAWDRV